MQHSESWNIAWTAIQIQAGFRCTAPPFRVFYLVSCSTCWNVINAERPLVCSDFIQKEQSNCTMAHHACQDLLTAMREWKSYPKNLPHATESRKLIEDFKRRFEETKERVLLVTDPKGERRRRARANAIKRKIRVYIYDSGIECSTTARDAVDDGENDSDSSPLLSQSIKSSSDQSELSGNTVSRRICNAEDLEDVFGFCPSKSDTHQMEYEYQDKPPTPPDFKPQADPVCRFM